MKENIVALWLWHKWDFGYWVDVFHGTEDECKKYLHEIYPSVEANGKYEICKGKPNYRLQVGNAHFGYCSRKFY